MELWLGSAQSFQLLSSTLPTYISHILLTCAIILLIKDKNGKTDDSNNYCGIDLSSLILKIFDWVVLIIFEKELRTSQYQFGFETDSSSAMCSWTAIEVINQFKLSGSNVYGCMLDYRKAFDFVNHSKMFKILIERHVSLIFIRLMVMIYLFQKCYIKWQELQSYSFSVTNGTRQGSVFSPRGGFACYLDPLLFALEKSGHGCSVDHHWYGALALADDVLLLATSVQSLQEMVKICETHARDFNLNLNRTDPDPAKSKTVCIGFNDKNWRNLPKVKLNGDGLPWREKHKHLGNKLHWTGTMTQDAREKRGKFISNCMEINQEFFFASAEVKVRMARLYNTSFFGSNTWNFSSKIVQQLCRSWNSNIRVAYELPCNTHCWIVEDLTGGRHCRQMLFKRFIKFVNSVLKNRRPFLRSLCKRVCKDIRTVTALNLATIQEETGLLVLPGKTMPCELMNWRVYKPEEDKSWIMPLLSSLLEIRDERWEVNFNKETEQLMPDELQTVIDGICTS